MSFTDELFSLIKNYSGYTNFLSAQIMLQDSQPTIIVLQWTNNNPTIIVGQKDGSLKEIEEKE